MFKFKIGQHVWFLVGPMEEGEDPEYLEGDIIKQYVDDDHHGSPDAWYKIQAADVIYDREEAGLYASFDELNKAVTADLQYWADYTRKRVKEIKKKLDEACADREAAKQRLARWEKRYGKVVKGKAEAVHAVPQMQ